VKLTDHPDQFSDLLLACCRGYLTTPAGQAHARAYPQQRASAAAAYAQLVRLDAQGVEITALVLRKLLPHSDSAAHRAQGAWISVAPAIVGDIRTWYEAAGITQAGQWPAVARALWRLVRRVVETPDALAAACADFAALPVAKGFQSGMVTPILNALRPDDFGLVNHKSRTVLNFFTGANWGPSLGEYPAVNGALQRWLGELVLLQAQAQAAEMRPDDLFDLFCHWLVSIRRLTLRAPAHWQVTLEDDPALWTEWQEGHYIGLGFDALGDLSTITQREFAARRDSLLAQYATWRKEDLNPVWRMARQVHEGDPVLVTDRQGMLLGHGVVSGPYYFVAEGGLGHRRLVEWEEQVPRSATLEAAHGVRKLSAHTFRQAIAAPPLPPPAAPRQISETASAYITAAHAELDAEIEPEPEPDTAHDIARAAQTPNVNVHVQPVYTQAACAAATGLEPETLAAWVRALERKGQAILYGPPGTGKTFVAQHLARHLIGGGDGFSEIVQFHPAYSYEDFVEGLRPAPGTSLAFRPTPGRFLNFCRRAADRRGRCVLIIDEINRANLAQVLGELLYLLEYREAEITLAGGTTLYIPANVRILGTMNSADRSLALVDHALRRRFAFLPLGPNPDLLRAYHAQVGQGFAVDGLIRLLNALNAAIGDPHLAVGHSYFLRPDLAQELPEIWQLEIEPYLEELFFDRPDEIAAWRWHAVAAGFGVGA
jgi:hypothetical protein